MSMADGEQPRSAGSRNVSDAPDARGAQDAPGDVTDAQESDAARRRRRAQFLRELHEAKQLRDRVQPRRARAARMRQQMRMRTFRW
ncbi:MULTISPECIES: hypothetical protein [Streptomyces]|uniref:Uncharacterized protein n=2 Tax=Streptomyces TaxID=1883 RepID=A0ABY2PKJ8_9ACTN|nr:MULTISPECIES: hypothetical protein [Streptomyces]MYT38863.1 hypothetical protein [Streptomyces sp. SID8356]MYT91808.1 hypothetical protein [Streptomyces sp. SID8359]MYU00997.1 hypothetical protein [Streptomyces sp. SID8350]NGO85103.1 hypothetical protein [Streptomyces sp. 196(2019)]ARI53335.1 hypothetical protein A6E92_14925 [Streptomyces sp. S8]